MLQNAIASLSLGGLTPPPINATAIPSLGMLGGMTPPDGETPEPAVTADHMKRFNKLIDFVKAKGYAGRPELDHDSTLRNKIFSEYNAANPSDSLPIEMVKPIQNEIQAYKQKALEDIKNGRGEFAGKPEDFMKGISQIDGIFGQKTSQWKFPEAYIINKSTGEKKKLGFAGKVDMTAQKAP